jgi:hypothetical protein
MLISNPSVVRTRYFAGIPLAVHGGRPSSRASSQRSVGTIASGFSRRPSSGGSRGVLVPASRAGAARAAAILLISCHLTTATTTAVSEQTSTDDNSQPDPEQQQQQRTGKLPPTVDAFLRILFSLWYCGIGQITGLFLNNEQRFMAYNFGCLYLTLSTNPMHNLTQ